MADSSVPVTAGAGTNIDTFTQPGGDHRQAVVLGDAAAANTAAVDASSRLAVVTPSTYTTGTITAANANLYVGAATAGSTVQITVPDGHSSWDAYINGTFSSGTTLYFQGSLDGTNWFPLNGRRNTDITTNDTTNLVSADFFGGGGPLGANPSNWRGVVGAIRFFRVVCAAFTAADSVVVQIATSAAVGAVFLNVVPQFKLQDSGSPVNAGLRADGFLNVRPDPKSLLQDTFESIDTTNTWTLGGITVPTGASGVLTVNPGTAANGSSFARSQPSFLNGSSAYLQNVFIITLDAAPVTGNTRFWGLGIPQATPTTGIPVLNGVVFEVRAADGGLYGTVYSNGAVTQSVPLTRPTDGAAHRYQILYRSSRAYFDIDGVAAGSIAFPIPAVSALPTTIGSVNGGAALGAAPILTSTLIGVGDSAGNNSTISDGTYPWRRAQVSAAGAMSVNLAASQGSTAAVTGTLSAAGVDTPGTVSIATTTGQIVAAVGAAGNATFHLVTSAFVGTVTFEASLNGGLNYSPIYSMREDGTGAESSAAISTAAAFIRAYTTGIPGFTHLRIRVAAYTSGTLAVVINQGPFLLETSPSLGASSAVIGTTRDLVAGQNRTIFSAQLLGGTLTTADTLVSLTPYRASVAGTAAASLTVTAAKTLRIQSISLTIIGSATATATAASARLRYSNTTTVVTSGPVADEISVNLAAVISNRGSANMAFGSDGFEIPAGSSLGVSVLGIASGTYDVVIKGYEY